MIAPYIMKKGNFNKNRNIIWNIRNNNLHNEVKDLKKLKKFTK